MLRHTEKEVSFPQQFLGLCEEQLSYLARVENEVSFLQFSSKTQLHTITRFLSLFLNILTISLPPYSIFHHSRFNHLSSIQIHLFPILYEFLKTIQFSNLSSHLLVFHSFVNSCMPCIQNIFPLQSTSGLNCVQYIFICHFSKNMKTVYIGKWEQRKFKLILFGYIVQIRKLKFAFRWKITLFILRRDWKQELSKRKFLEIPFIRSKNKSSNIKNLF